MDPLADDVAWAERTVAGLPGVEHLVIPAAEMPLIFAGVTELVDRFDEPCSATVDGARWLTIVPARPGRGSRLHLTGFGGDELLYGSVAHLHDLLRTRPRTGLRTLRGFAAKYRWPRRAVLRQLADTRPYGQWLAGVARHRHRAAAGAGRAAAGLGLRGPDAALGHAGRRSRRSAARSGRGPDVEPLSPRRGQQRELETMRYLSRMTRQLDQAAGRPASRSPRRTTTTGWSRPGSPCGPKTG